MSSCLLDYCGRVFTAPKITFAIATPPGGGCEPTHVFRSGFRNVATPA